MRHLGRLLTLMARASVVGEVVGWLISRHYMRTARPNTGRQNP